MPKRAMPVAILLGLVPCLALGQVLVGPEFQVNSFTPSFQGSPSVASDANGNFVVVWISAYQDGQGTGVFGQRHDAVGGRIGGEFLVNTYTTASQSRPSVAADPLGRFMVVWQNPDEPGLFATDVFARHYDGYGTPGFSDFRVNTYTTGVQTQPAIAASGNGSFAVVWVSHGQYGSGSAPLIGRVYDAFGTPRTGEFPISPGTRPQVSPTVAGDADGNFVVVWAIFEGGAAGHDLFGQRFNSFGGAITAEFPVNSFTTGDQWAPAVTSVQGGNFVVFWQGQDGDGYGVFGQLFLASGLQYGDQFQVNVYTTGNQGQPVVASDADGNFVVAWESRGQDGSYIGVFARRYDASGAPGNEFRVNSFTTDSQYHPTIASTSSAQFVVAWQTRNQDGSDYGIFGQRFSTDLSLDVIFKDCFSPFSCP
jgi:hypothetical protein